MPKKNVFTKHKASTLAKYVSVTHDIYDSWGGRKGKLPDPWFRGLSNSANVLQPGWYRLGKQAKGVDEDDLRDEFERRAIPLIDGHRPSNAWEWYFLMQHYGLPTRLLDWSECSLVALYFAIGDWKGRGETPGTDAIVWMLDPWYLNKWSRNKNEVFRYDERNVARYLPRRLYGKDKSPKGPVALMPLYNSRRLTAQRGVFTMHGKDKRPLEKMLPKRRRPHFCKIVIPRKRILLMRESLRLAGITDVNLFPEMSYLSQDILRAWWLLGTPVRGRN
jgi:hypothetical protein